MLWSPGLRLGAAWPLAPPLPLCTAATAPALSEERPTAHTGRAPGAPGGGSAGQCDFGSNCRFSHMSERDLQELSIRVEEERRAREWPLDPPELPEGHLEDWLEKRAKQLSSAPSSRAEPIRATVFQYPMGWPPVQELPPSLRAPPPGGWPLQPRVQWG
nr:zinc finger matrin-type protein 5 isoform X2 [Oryctolagus cuniculus]